MPSSSSIPPGGNSKYGMNYSPADVPSNRTSDSGPRPLSSSPLSSRLPEGMPSSRLPDQSPGTQSRIRAALPPPQGSATSDTVSEKLARYVRHAQENRMNDRDEAIYDQIDLYRQDGTLPTDPVARELVAWSGRFIQPSNGGPVAQRTNAIGEALQHLHQLPGVGGSSNAVQPPRASAQSGLPSNAHRIAANAFGEYLLSGHHDQKTTSLIGEIIAFEVNGALPAEKSPMRPIADIVLGWMSQTGLNADKKRAFRQDTIFRALSNELGVKPAQIVGRPGLTGVPANIQSVQKDSEAMATWIEELAWRNVDPSILPETQRAVQQIADYIEKGEVPSPQTPAASIVELARTPNSSPGSTPHGTPAVRSGQLDSTGGTRVNTAPSVGGAADNVRDREARRSEVARALLSIPNNMAQSPGGQFASSVANSVTRNIVSVMLPTILRQYLSQGLATDIRGRSQEVQLALGMTASLIPPVLLVLGACINREKSTPPSDVSRAVLALTTFGAVAIAVSTGKGNMESAAPSLIGYLIYAAMRDGVQKIIKLDNPNANPQLRVGMSAMGALGYTANQAAINTMMGRESPSGAAAAGMSLQGGMGMARGATNMLGETGDDVFSNWLESRRAGKPLRLTLSNNVPSRRELASTYTTTAPARASLGVTDILLTGVIGAALENTDLSPTAQNNLNNFFGAAVLGILYPAFVHLHQERLQNNGSTRSVDETGDVSDWMFQLSLQPGSSTRSVPPATTRSSAYTGNVSLGGTAPTGTSSPPSTTPSLNDAAKRLLPPSSAASAYGEQSISSSLNDAAKRPLPPSSAASTYGEQSISSSLNDAAKTPLPLSSAASASSRRPSTGRGSVTSMSPPSTTSLDYAAAIPLPLSSAASTYSQQSTDPGSARGRKDR
jgi:hypothetical protein